MTFFANSPILQDKVLLASHLLMLAVTITSCVTPLPVFVHLLGMAVPMIYIGAQLSLLVDQNLIERIEQSEAMLFPVIGSVVLFSLYLVYKFLDKVYVDMLVQIYFTAAGFASTMSYLSTTICLFLSPHTSTSAKQVIFSMTLPNLPSFLGGPKETDKSKPNKAELSRIDLISIPFAFIPVYFYLFQGHWLANNAMAVAFAIQAIQWINIGSFSNGAIILVGLFFYDIFWVFGTDVMVTVATSFDAPIKLLFPRESGRPSLLGLGDIVIPGIFIALMLRFDKTIGPKNALYFTTCLISYMIGIAVTLFVMFAFEHAQPALLYLVPCCLLSVLSVSLMKGQFWKLVQYEESDGQEKKHSE